MSTSHSIWALFNHGNQGTAGKHWLSYEEGMLATTSISLWAIQYNVHTNKKAVDNIVYRTSNSREYMGINGEVLQLRAVNSHIFYCKSCKNLYHVLQITWAVFEHAMKSKFGKIKSLSPWYQAIPEKNNTHLLPLTLLFILCTCNNTDGNSDIFRYSFLPSNYDRLLILCAYWTL